MYWSFLEVLIPSETYYVEILFWYKHKIHELEIFTQTTKIDTHEEKYFHSTYISYIYIK